MLKIKLRSIAVNKKIFLLPILAASIAASVGAQTPAPTKVGVIQIQAALANTKDGQKALADLDTKMEPRKKNLEKQQADLQSLQDQMQRGGNAMSDTAKAELQRSFDQKKKVFDRDVEDANTEAETEQRKILDELGPKMQKVIDKYAVANGYSLILDVSNQSTPVVYMSNSAEITKDIIEAYDKAYPAAAAPAKPAATPGAGSSSPAVSPTKPAGTAPAASTPRPPAAPAAGSATKKQP